MPSFSSGDVDAHVHLVSYRINIGTWILFGFVLSNFYVSVRYALLMDPPYGDYLDTSEDYVRVPKTIVALRNSATETLHAKWGLSERSIFVTAEEMAEVYVDLALKDRRYALSVWRNVIRNWLFNYPESVTTKKVNPQNFRMTKGYAMLHYTAVGLQKMSPYTEHVSNVIIKLQVRIADDVVQSFKLYKCDDSRFWLSTQ
jgi:hypothetical protein